MLPAKFSLLKLLRETNAQYPFINEAVLPGHEGTGDYTILDTLNWPRFELFAMQIGLPLSDRPVFATRIDAGAPAKPQTAWQRFWGAVRLWVLPS